MDHPLREERSLLDMDPLDRELRLLMRQWATGVALVTVREGHVDHGMTVNTFTSVSLDPPLVLVCLETTTRTHAMVERVGGFGICILSEGQQWIADRFAGRIPDTHNRFEGIPYFVPDSRFPFPEGCLAYLECDTWQAHPAGTHTVFIGKVYSYRVLSHGSPLVYYDQTYRSIVELEDEN